MVLAVSPAVTTVVIVAIVLFVAIWIAIFVAIMRDRRARTPVPANLKPFIEDDVLETTRLERMLQGAVVTLLILAVVMGGIFLYEPTRMRTMFTQLSKQSVARGAIIYGPTTEVVDGVPHPILGAFACERCHGIKGVGGSAPYQITTANGQQQNVTWTAPSLNDVFLRYSDDSVRTTITYGRPGTPMPSWGTAGGGPMDAQQIEDVMDYLHSIQVSETQELSKNGKAGLVAGDPAQGTAVYDGSTLFNQFCARCHTIGYSYGQPEAPGSGGFGPSLRGGSEIRQFPVQADQVKFVQTGDVWQKPYGVRGIGQGRMPGFGKELYPQQVEAIVRFERSLIAGYDGPPLDASGNAVATAAPTTTTAPGKG